ncbi:MAG TPA: hypothetical protein VKV03_08795, partial [Candidatus Binataceae bacterium]|nr:hypothetical protein [Candidatus Binataceae bacterium]
RDAAARHSFVMFAGMILPMLLLMLAFPSGIRPRVIAASVGLAIATMTMATTMTACDPCPACTTAKLTTTDQTVMNATVTGFEGQPFSVTGVPTLLSQLSK